MGRTARIGIMCLMALAIGLARLVEVELDPGAPPALTIAPAADAKPAIEESPGPSSTAQSPDVPTRVEPPIAEDVAWPHGRIYVVKSGETLGVISQKVYGTTKHWKQLHAANLDVIPNPARMRAGVKLKLPRIDGR